MLMDPWNFSVFRVPPTDSCRFLPNFRFFYLVNSPSKREDKGCKVLIALSIRILAGYFVQFKMLGLFLLPSPCWFFGYPIIRGTCTVKSFGTPVFSKILGLREIATSIQPM